jgi:tetratricopeptide (TPR) repeat protein
MLTDVIDAQLSPEPNPVGNCLGLTSLYTVIGMRQGLDINAIVITNHVASIVNAGKEKIAVENIHAEGFGIKYIIPDAGHDFVGIRGLNSLVAMVLSNRGLGKEINGDLKGAFADYSKAIEIDISLPNMYNNRALALEAMGSTLAALEDYGDAIRVCPEYATPYKNRGELKLKLNDINGAIEDFNEAIEINPNYRDAFRRRGHAKDRLGDIEGANADYEIFLKLKGAPQ